MWVEQPSHLWRNIILSVLGLCLLCVGGCLALVAGGVIGTASKQHSQSVAGAKSCAGKSYPDHQKNNDHCANRSNTVTTDNVTVTATALRRDGSEGLCTTVSYANNSSETIDYNPLDWKLQAPSGQVEDSSLVGNGSLPAGELVAGGHTKGTLCFDSISSSGQFVLINKPDPVAGQRRIWLYQL